MRYFDMLILRRWLYTHGDGIAATRYAIILLL